LGLSARKKSIKAYIHNLSELDDFGVSGQLKNNAKEIMVAGEGRLYVVDAVCVRQFVKVADHTI